MAVADELMKLGTVSGPRIKQLIRDAAKVPIPAAKARRHRFRQVVAGGLIEDAGTMRIGGRATMLEQSTWDGDKRGFALLFRQIAFDDHLSSRPDIGIQSFHNEENIVAQDIERNGQVLVCKRLYRIRSDVRQHDRREGFVLRGQDRIARRNVNWLGSGLR